MLQCKAISYTKIREMCNWRGIAYEWYTISYEQPLLILFKVERVCKTDV